MLKSLFVKDYALIEKIEVEFQKGLTIITGETGAGKSILLDALSMLLGERASVEVIRKDADKAIVEGIFEPLNANKVNELLLINEIDFHNELIIRREISRRGSGRCFINDSPVSLSILKELGDLLVDLHGQHEHQALLNTNTHAGYLDSFGAYTDELSEYKESYKMLISLMNMRDELLKEENNLKQKKNLFTFQLKELDLVNPFEGEDFQLESELNLVENSEKLFELSNAIYSSLYDLDKSALDLIHIAKVSFSELVEIDKSLEESFRELVTVSNILNDISSVIRDYKNKINFDPSESESVRLRLNSLNVLKKKYSMNLPEILEYRNKIKGELSKAEDFDLEIEKINSEILLARKSCAKIAEELSEKRCSAGVQLSNQIMDLLRELGINLPKFSVSVTKQEDGNSFNEYKDGINYKFSSTGVDIVQFYISTNAGEELKPLVKVASGGEISRIMLSLKTALAKNDTVSLMVFDEIDTGVSGRIGQKVGVALKNLSKFKQIIAITHLPQIAALSDSHFIVEKIQDAEKSISRLKKLTSEEKLFEVAKLLSGEKVTEQSLETARELINFGITNYSF